MIIPDTCGMEDVGSSAWVTAGALLALKLTCRQTCFHTPVLHVACPQIAHRHSHCVQRWKSPDRKQAVSDCSSPAQLIMRGLLCSKST